MYKVKEICFRAAREGEGAGAMGMGSWFSGMRERSVPSISQHTWFLADMPLDCQYIA